MAGGGGPPATREEAAAIMAAIERFVAEIAGAAPVPPVPRGSRG